MTMTAISPVEQGQGDYLAPDWAIHQGDCLEVMPREIADASIDAVIADLPYGTTGCAWDTIVPLEALWHQLRRVMKPNTPVILTAAQPFSSMLVMSNPKWYRYEWIWEKPIGTGHLNAERQPLRSHESILVFSSESAPPYCPQMEVGAPYTPFTSSRYDTTEVYGRQISRHRGSDGSRYPKTVLRFAHEQQQERFHPNQKPVALMAYLARTYVKPGALVLDMTMGSGSTGVACIREGCRFVGIEKDAKYCQIAERRLVEATQQTPLFGREATSPNATPTHVTPALFTTENEPEVLTHAAK